MPQQIEEVEEIDETLEISKVKIRNIQKANGEDPMQFELTEVIKANRANDNDYPEYNKDREEDEQRESYVITVKNKKKREIVLDAHLNTVIEGAAEDEEEERKYTVLVDKTGFKGLPEELQKQLETSGFDTKQIQEHPEQVLQVLAFANKKAAAEAALEK